MFVPQVTIVGGGLITHDQLLPAVYQMQRLGLVGEVSICARTTRRLRDLASAADLKRAFPGQCFRAFPDLACDPDQAHPDLFAEVIARMPPRNLIIAAVPDQLHYRVIMQALAANQHVLAVKPLVLKVSEAAEIEREAARRGLLVGIEYHKRFDDRSLLARRQYREGLFGEFRLGSARLLEKWYYRHSNFQNWCTVENSDAFTYIGCHYVDLVHFITGLLPAAVSVHGIRDKYPNGNEGYLWTDARVVWNNGAVLNVQNALGFPDAAPGSNSQGLTMYCSGGGNGALIEHSDQYRGLKYSYVRTPGGPGATQYAEPSPDYMQYLDLGGPGLVPAGYGYRSVEYILRSAIQMERELEDLAEAEALTARRQKLKTIDEGGIIATPANSRYNELVVEAGRRSITNRGHEVSIE